MSTQITISPEIKLLVNTTPITGGSAGQILFQTTGNTVGESSNLVWDNTNGTLEATTTADNLFGLRLKSTTGQLRVKPYLNPTYGVLFESKTADGSANLPLTLSGSKLLLADGNVLINTTTDAGFRLDVVGNARIQGSTTTSTSLTISGGFVMTEASNVHTFTAPATNRTIRFITNSQSFSLFPTGNFAIGTTTDAGYKLDVIGNIRGSNNLVITNIIANSGQLSLEPGASGSRIRLKVGHGLTDGVVIDSDSNSVLSTGDYSVLRLALNFAPTSGNSIKNYITVNPTINQTGGANGITRGLYINPTLTAAADFRAIETTAGKVIFGNLPTSSAGLPTGAIWNDAGTLKIV